MWRPATRNDGISIPWTSVSLHAITSDPRSIYMQLDFRLKWPGVYEGKQNGHNGVAGAGGDGDEDRDDDVDEGNVSGKHLGDKDVV